MPAAVRKKHGTFGHWYVSGPLTGLFTGLLALYAAAMLLSGDVLPPAAMEETVIVAVFAGAAVGGIVAAKRRGSGALAAGAATGAVCFAVLALLAVLSPSGHLFSDGCLRMLICTLGGGAFGGALCIRQSGKRPRRRRGIRKA